MNREPNFLVIHGSGETRKVLSQLFVETGIVETASTAAEGLSLLSDAVDIVLLDYVLPDRDGASLLKEMKSRFPSIPMVVVTAYGSEEVCQKVFRMGAMDYIRAPFDPEDMRTRVKALVKLRKSGREQRRCVFREEPPEEVCAAPPGIPQSVAEGILAARRHIDRNFADALSIPKMTRAAGLNRTYFCRYFKLIVGCTFRDYVVRVRLTAARELLKDRRLSVSEVAERVGYSPKHFSEVYKETFGFPPRRPPR